MTDSAETGAARAVKSGGRRRFLKQLLGLPLGLGFVRTLYGKQVERKAYLLNVFSVAGYAYYEGERVEGGLRPGQVLRLVPEPTNPYDPFAVEIFTGDGVKLGYVPRRDNKAIHRLLSQGAAVEGRIEAVRQDRPFWQRLKVSVWLLVESKPSGVS